MDKLIILLYGSLCFSGDPHNDANAVGTDAFKTLFIGRIVCFVYQSLSFYSDHTAVKTAEVFHFILHLINFVVYLIFLLVFYLELRHF